MTWGAPARADGAANRRRARAAWLAASFAILALLPQPAAAQDTGRLTLCGNGELKAASPPRLRYRHDFRAAAPAPQVSGTEIFGVADSSEGVVVFVAAPRAAGGGALAIRRYRIAAEGAPVLQAEFSAAAPDERMLHLLADGAVLVEHGKTDALHRAGAMFIHRPDGSSVELARRLPPALGILRYLGPARAGGFYLAAEVTKRTSESSDTAVILRLDASGRMLWQVALAPSEPSAHASAILAEHDDGHALIVSPRFSGTAAITLIDANGRVVRQSRFDPRVEGAWIMPDTLMPSPSPPHEMLALYRLTGSMFGSGNYLLAWIAADVTLYGVFAAEGRPGTDALSRLTLVRGRYDGLFGADAKGNLVRYSNRGDELWRHARAGVSEIRWLCALGGRTVAVIGRNAVTGDADRAGPRHDVFELYQSD